MAVSRAFSFEQLNLFTIAEENTENQTSLSGKTFLERLVAMAGGTFKRSFPKSYRPKFQCLVLGDGPKQEWCEMETPNLPGAPWMLNIGASPSIAKESSLSQILAGGGGTQVLFESQGLSGDIAAGGKVQERTAADANGDSQTAVLLDMSHANRVLDEMGGNLSPTLTARMGTGGNQVPLVYNRNMSEGFTESPTVKTLTAKEAQNANILCVDDTHRREPRRSALSPTLQAGMGGGGGLIPLVLGNGQGHDSPSEVAHTLSTMHDQQIVQIREMLRRLTPLECERLQGLPDNYTNVPLNGKPASDTARYKAVGNGMAQPCADFVMKCVKEIGEQNEK